MGNGARTVMVMVTGDAEEWVMVTGDCEGQWRRVMGNSNGR